MRTALAALTLVMAAGVALAQQQPPTVPELLTAEAKAALCPNRAVPPARLLCVAGSEMAVSFTTQAVVSGLSNPTTLQFGPDGRLYVAQQDGLIKIYDVTQPVPGQWAAVEAETLSLIKNIPNHNDDGSLNTSITDRQVTGIAGHRHRRQPGASTSPRAIRASETSAISISTPTPASCPS